MDESTAEQWQAIATETVKHQPRVADRVLAMLRVAGRDHRRLRRRPADPLAADGDPGRGGRGRHRDGRGLALPRHRQGGLGANHPRIAAEILRPYVRDEVFSDDLGPPGLPGPPLLRVLQPEPRRPRTSTRASPGTSWPSGSPTTGTRRASTRTTRPSRSSTSSRWSERSSLHPVDLRARWPLRADGAPAPPDQTRTKALQRLVVDLARPRLRGALPRPQALPGRRAHLRLRGGGQHRRGDRGGAVRRPAAWRSARS